MASCYHCKYCRNCFHGYAEYIGHFIVNGQLMFTSCPQATLIRPAVLNLDQVRRKDVDADSDS